MTASMDGDRGIDGNGGIIDGGGWLMDGDKVLNK